MGFKTKLVNKTGGEILVQQATEGLCRPIAQISHGEEHIISVDPNATYRDYVMLEMPTRAQLPYTINSDDCMEYSVITVLGAGNGYYLEKESRKTEVPKSSAAGSGGGGPSNGAAASSNGAAASSNGAAASGDGAAALNNTAPKGFFQKVRNRLQKMKV